MKNKFKYISPVLWCFIAIVFATAQTSGTSFVLIGDNIPLRPSGEPRISLTTDKSHLPAAENWQILTDSIVSAAQIKTFNNGAYWLSIPVVNTSDSVIDFILKSYSTSSRVFVKNPNSSDFDFILDDNHYNRYVKETYYPAALISLSPGAHELFLYCETVMKYKGHLSQIIFEQPSGVLDDYTEFVAYNKVFLLVLYAFTAMLAFQILYVLIQFYYHRKREYLENILYLVCTFIYFSVRLEHITRTDILTGWIPESRLYLNDLMILIPYFFYLRFGRTFIGLQQKYPAMNRQIKWAEWLILILALVILFATMAGVPLLSPAMMLFIGISLFSYSVYLIIYFFKRRDKLINFILAGSLSAAIGYFMGMILTVLMMAFHADVWPPLVFSMTGITFEIFFFNTGLGYKAKYEQEEKLLAQGALIAQMEKNQFMNEQLHTIRNKIANDLHDDVGSTLGSISLYSEIAGNQIEKNPNSTKGILQKITTISQRMLESMNDIVWSLHDQKDNKQSMESKMKQFVSDRISPLDIKFELEIDKAATLLNFTMEARRELFLFFKEAVNNAAKYSKSASIHCSLKVEDYKLIITITDFGSGFDPSSVKQGNGTLTMRKRIESLHGVYQINSTPGSGTVVQGILNLETITIG